VSVLAAGGGGGGGPVKNNNRALVSGVQNIVQQRFIDNPTSLAKPYTLLQLLLLLLLEPPWPQRLWQRPLRPRGRSSLLVVVIDWFEKLDRVLSVIFTWVSI